MENNAVVVGALGVIGRYIVERLLEGRDWRVVVATEDDGRATLSSHRRRST